MEQPVLLSWPLNNHWFTNFRASQRGWMRFRYRLLPHAAPFDPVAATRFGAEAAVEPICGPVWDRPSGLDTRSFPFAPHLAEQASFLRVEPENAHLVGLKPAEDGRGVIARLQEIAGRECEFRLRFDLCDILSAERCDLVESTDGAEPLAVSGGSVSGHLAPYRLQTIRIVLKG
jgi:alpha-mannosidase